MKAHFDRIQINPRILLGKPVIAGTRIPIYAVVNLAAEGKTTAEIQKHYPDLTREDVRQALSYAAWATQLTDDGLIAYA